MAKTVTDLNSKGCDGDVSIVIGREPPYRFRAMSESFLQHFRFGRQDLGASSLRVLFGPETDQQEMCALVAGRRGPSAAARAPAGAAGLLPVGHRGR